jgi:anaphase-promoting complex subunit 3
VLALLRALGSPLKALAHFRCGAAVDELLALPPRHRDTGWVQAQLGRACYESAKYPRARQAFEEMRRVAPERVEGLEVYSSVLWHLRLHSDLVHLAQTALAFDRSAPQTWCVMANAVSAQRDHTRALLYLKRALQLDPACVYALSLRGHELVAINDLDGAAEAFREATRVNPRHYNAWYGLGTVFFKQQRHAAAESHFRQASAIHGSSAVLLCYLGLSLAAQELHAAAAEVLRRACALDRGSAQARFQLAGVYTALGNHEAARLELLAVHEDRPREVAVLVALGRACKKVGRTDDAIKYLNLALEAASAGPGMHPALPALGKRRPATELNRIREELARVGSADEEAESEW